VIQLLPHFLFGAWCQRGSETFIYLSRCGTLNFYVFGFGTMACNNS
jgi:hypothetical protein